MALARSGYRIGLGHDDTLPEPCHGDTDQSDERPARCVTPAYYQRLDMFFLVLSRMCDLAGIAMRRATTALLNTDLRLADQVIADDLLINEARARTEHDGEVLLALQAPAATDLRTMVTVLRSTEKVERMGDVAVRLATATGRIVRDRDLVLVGPWRPPTTRWTACTARCSPSSITRSETPAWPPPWMPACSAGTTNDSPTTRSRWPAGRRSSSPAA